MEESHTDMPINNSIIQKLVEAVNNLPGRVETMDVSVAERVTKTLEASVQAQVEARMALFETEMKNKMAILEEDINVLKGKDEEKVTSNAGNSKAHEDDDTCSNTMSWMVQTKKGSVDGLPIQRVVKKEKMINKTMLGKKVKIEKPFSIPQLNDQSISTEDWENHLKWQKSVKCRLALEALASSLEEPTRKRKTKLTKTQVFPYVRNSTVKRIVSGKTVSKESYDPLAKVAPEKLKKVLDFIKSDLEDAESGYGDRSARFYLTLLLPREAWPTQNYGWLHDSRERRRRSEREREKERKKDGNNCMLPPGVLARATTRQDVVKLGITINRSTKPRHDRSPDESVRTVQSFAVRVRFVHAPPPGIASAVARRRPPPANFPVRRCRSLPSPPVTDTGDSPIWSLFEQLEFIDTTFLLLRRIQRRTSVCRIVWRLRPTLVDRLSCSLVCVDKSSTGGVRALSRAVLCFWPVSGRRVCTSLGPLSMDYGVASHTSLSDSPVAHPSLFPFSSETNNELQRVMNFQMETMRVMEESLLDCDDQARTGSIVDCC
ncbi:unnamed protein product [Brassica napus]|uniref:(rape) hypothetical protein n=1 Tax=Brassica napus TaxID=3708 RepID=A0A816IXV0_BRANA|nr:unnamed protein product [Brassica napus]